MGYFIKWFGGLMIVILANLPVYASFSFDVGQELTQGQTDYDIGISLLEFPVSNTVFPYVNGNYEISDKIRVSAQYSSGQNNNQSQKFLDSDFRIANNPSTLYIYSESDNDLQMQQFSFDLNYSIITKSNFDVYLGAGLKQHKFNYEVYNVHQQLIGVSGSDQFINGVTALTYESTETIPYLTLGFTQNWETLSLSVETQYSSLVSYKGYDDHVLRSKHIHFSGTGEYLSVAVQARYTLQDQWSFGLGYRYASTSTFGEHTQTRYVATTEGAAGLIGTGTQATQTTLSSLNASLSYQF